MVALKITAISLGAILAFIILALIFISLLRLKLILTYGEDGKINFKVKVLCFTFGGKSKKPKKKKKPSKLAQRLKKRFGLDIFDDQDGAKAPISEKVNYIVALIMIFAGQIKFIFSKLRLDRLYALIICGDGDAADAAMNYGLACAAVYPMVGYLTANVNTKKGAEEVRIGCDFDGLSRLEFQLIISIKIYNLIFAAAGAMNDMTALAERTDNNNEQ